MLVTFLHRTFHGFHGAGGQPRALHVPSKYSVAEPHAQPFLLFSDTNSSNFRRQNSIALSSWGQFPRNRPAALGD